MIRICVSSLIMFVAFAVIVSADAKANDATTSAFGTLTPPDTPDYRLPLSKDLLHLGALMARDCFDSAIRNNRFRADQFHDFVSCVEKVYPNVRYLENSDKIKAAGMYVTELFIIKDDFIEIKITKIFLAQMDHPR